MIRRKNSVVTGGATGIGKKIVINMARAGFNVAFMDLDFEAGLRLQEDIELMYGIEAFFFHGDICMQDDVETFCNAFMGRFSRLDCLVLNGCEVSSSLINPMNGEEFGDALRQSLAAPFTMAQMFKKHFTKGSCMTHILNAKEPKDAEEKMMLETVREAILSMSVRMSETYQGIVRVNCITSGKQVIKEGEEKPVAVSYDVVKAVEFLCEEKAHFINGQNLVIDGLMAGMIMYHGEGGWSFRRK